MAVIKSQDLIAGKYRVERVLGEGGMGFVVLARHVALDTLVAIKFIREGVVNSREASARFLREAQSAVALRNPHVAQVFDVGTLSTGEPYMVMEYLEGCDLGEVYRTRRVLPIAEACDYVIQACDGLGAAHASGVIHRDVKLGNLFLTTGPARVPTVKVLDFGLSKASPFDANDTFVTMSAAVLGSPRFMSPEQLQDPRTVDGRTDVWALGVILYTLLSGYSPFEGDTVGKLFAKVMTEDPAPLASHGVRADLADVVHACLQKSRDLRTSNVAELAYGLAPFCSNPGLAEHTASRIAAVLRSSKVPSVAAAAQASLGPGSLGPKSTSGLKPGSMDGAAAWTGTLAEPATAKSGASSLPLLLSAGLGLVAIAAVYLYKGVSPASHVAGAPASSVDLSAALPVPGNLAASANAARVLPSTTAAAAPSGTAPIAVVAAYTELPQQGVASAAKTQAPDVRPVVPAMPATMHAATTQEPPKPRPEVVTKPDVTPAPKTTATARPPKGASDIPATRD